MKQEGADSLIPCTKKKNECTLNNLQFQAMTTFVFPVDNTKEGRVDYLSGFVYS